MPLQTHGDPKYRRSTLDSVAEWDALRIEHRRIGSGPQNCVTPECTELVYILSGVAKVTRRADGRTQEGIARPGTSWLVPAGTHETLLELDGSTECLLIYLPAALLDDSALADYELDPKTIQLAYAGGFMDPTLAHVATSLHGLLGRENHSVDGILVDGLRTTLAAHLISHHSVDHWRSSARVPALDAGRLQRVLELIESKLSEDISLGTLASEACLSPFHFSRLFRAATGLSPHRYVTERRVRVAQARLSSAQSSIVDIALETGFGSQANFSRAFRRATGLTPGQFRHFTSREGAASSTRDSKSAHNFARSENTRARSDA